MSRSIYVLSQNKVLGPFDEARIRAEVAAGRITQKHMFSYDGSQWFPAADIWSQFAGRPEVPSLAATSGNAGEWFYTYQGRIVGPVTLDALQRLAAAGQLSPTDSLRSANGSQSLLASQLDGLSFPNVQPSFDFNTVSSRRTAKTAKSRTAKRSNASKTIWTGLIISAIVAAVGLAAFKSGIQDMKPPQPTPKMTKQAFKETLAKLVIPPDAVQKNKLVDALGNPEQTQTVGEHTYWYYTCSDGAVQLVIWQYGNPQVEDQIGKGAILVSRVNDY